MAAKSIRNINTAKIETAVVRNFGGAVSLSCLNRHRVDGFESKKAAEVKTLKNITDIKEKKNCSERTSTNGNELNERTRKVFNISLVFVAILYRPTYNTVSN